MKNSIRLVMIFSAGLSLAGCVSQQTAAPKTPPPPETAYADRPRSARDHFYFRELEDKQERALLQPGR